MTTFRYLTKIVFDYMLTLLASLFLALGVFVIGTWFIVSDQSRQLDVDDLVNQIVIKDSYQLTPEVKKTLTDNHIWVMVLGENGELKDSYGLPQRLKHDYQLTDIAQMSRWYLDDYPVFTHIIGNDLLILGYPKNSYARIPNVLSFSLFQQTLILFGLILLSLLVFYFLLYLRAKVRLRREFQPITDALESLSNQEPVQLDAKGNLSEIKIAINKTSDLLEENRDLRSHWIRGISHDLRNPLTLILSYNQKLVTQYGELKENQQIEANIHQMENIISNLNMSYLLESSDLENEMTVFNLSGLLRQMIAHYYNDYPTIELDFSLPEKDIFMKGNQSLLERALNNLILNSLKHNHHPKQWLKLEQVDDYIYLKLQDNGQITIQEIEQLNKKSHQYSTHGMGTLISKQIVQLHQGHIYFSYANPGLEINITLPKVNEKN